MKIPSAPCSSKPPTEVAQVHTDYKDPKRAMLQSLLLIWEKSNTANEDPKLALLFNASSRGRRS